MTQPPAPLVETPNLLLRPPVKQDFPAWTDFMADAEAARFIGGVQAPAQSWRGLMTMAGAWALEGIAMFSVIEKSSGAWVGRVGPWRPHDWPGNEVGWGIVRSRWGKGYAVEAAAASMDYAIDVLGWTDIIHCIDPANIASQRVAAKLGSVNRGPGRMPAPFESSPIDVWGQSAASWKARSR